MLRRTPSGMVLVAVALTQVIAGGLISTGCLCGPSFRLVGLAVSFSMAGFVGLFGALAFLSRKYARSAVSGAAFLEGVVIILMLLPSFQPPLIAWYSQLIVYAEICLATVLAFRTPR